MKFSASVGWESLLAFVKNSIFNGSKEVSLAAINCLQTAVVSHCVKVTMQLNEQSMSYNGHCHIHISLF